MSQLDSARRYETPPTNVTARPRRARPPTVEAIAGWSARHRKTAVFGWLGLVAVAYLIGQLLGSPSLQQNDLGQAGQAEQTLQHLGVTAPTTEAVLIQVRAPEATFATDPAMRQAVSQVTAALSRLPGAAAYIHSPLVSANGRSALVTFDVPGRAVDVTTAVTPALDAVAKVQARHPDLLVAEGGDASLGQAVNNQISSDFGKATETSLPVTLILLAGVFGTLAAAGIPVLLALTSALTATWLLAIPGHWLPVGSQTSTVVLLVGMAVGVDYSLFFLRRQREERAHGAELHQAIAAAARTSGRAIVVSGLTVMTALAGLFLTGYALFTGMAIGAIIVVGIAATGSLTVLPALLSWLGDRVDKGRIPLIGRRRTNPGPSKAWAALVRKVVRRPLLWGAAATVVMLAIAAPALGIRLAYPAIDAPADLPVVSTVEAIQAAFPQSPAPAEVVVTGQHLTGPAVTGAITELGKLAAAGGPIREPVTATSVAGGRALIVSVPLAGNGGAGTSYNALDTLRDRILPETLGQAGVSYAVEGDTAASHDDASQLSARTPLVLAVVAAVAFCLLLLAFRSLMLPLVSIALNFLSVAAAYGLITFIFQAWQTAGTAGLRRLRRDHPVGAAVPVHVPVRHLHGLPRLHPEPDQGTAAERRDHGRRHHVRHRQQRRRRLQRRAHHGRGLLHLHRHGTGRTEDARHRSGRRHPAGRHHRPRRPPPRGHDPARRPVLVPARPHPPAHQETDVPPGRSKQRRKMMNPAITMDAASGNQPRTGNWAIRGAVAVGRGVVLFGFTLAGLVLWTVLLTAVALIPLGVGLPLTAITLRAMRGREAKAWRHVADWCGFAAAAPRPAGPASQEVREPSFWVRFGFLMADPDTWRSLLWSTVDILAGLAAHARPGGPDRLGPVRRGHARRVAPDRHRTRQQLVRLHPRDHR